ncbi:MAG: LLM class flavin-dependent oxidoreductase, partial [Brevundimonas sp.]|nr:LLM class flavin-dependent oxidoreductase [Brevundimonas sp.]
LDAGGSAAGGRRLTYAAIGGEATVRAKLAEFIALTGVEEVMVTGMIFDLEARLRSLEITARAAEGL